MMSTIFNVGFYLHYLWELRDKIAQDLGPDLSQQLKILSSFSISESETTANFNRPPVTVQRLTTIFSNLISRGLPTLPSLLVERSILQFVNHMVPVQEEERSGSIHFHTGRVNQKIEQKWFEYLRRAHFLGDCRLSEDFAGLYSNGEIAIGSAGNETERRFLDQYLPGQIGREVAMLVETRRDIPTMVPGEQAKPFANQQAGYSLEVGGIRAVFEVDQPQLQSEAQKAQLRGRDLLLASQQWQVIHTPADCLSDNLAASETNDGWRTLQQKLDQDQAVQALRRNAQRPLWDDENGLSALIAVLSPFAIARMQKALLLAVENGVLPFGSEQWKLLVVEHDVPGALLGLVDFLEHFQAFQDLMGTSLELPDVELIVYRTQPFQSCHLPINPDLLARYRVAYREIVLGQERSLDAYDGDLLIDLAVLAPQGLHALHPDFVQEHLHTQGVVYEIRSCLHSVNIRRLRSMLPAPHSTDDQTVKAIQFFLGNIFRKYQFREGQLEILLRAISLRPVIGLLPTGAGKSLCYQLAALLQPGLTLIVDPLLSLMTDQMDNLRENFAIDWFSFISSQKNAAERTAAEREFMSGNCLFMFISPERLQNKDFRSTLLQFTQSFAVAYAVIDEAHCVSEWGHDFRTSYLKLGKTILDFCRFQNQPPSIIALTGTASHAVLSDVQREIGVDEESAKVYPSNFGRRELVFHFESVGSKDKSTALIRRMKGLPNFFQAGETFFTSNGDSTFSGLIFAPHVNGKYGVYQIAANLSAQLHTRVEYFSGEPPKTKMDGQNLPVMTPMDYGTHKVQIQRAFKRNEFPVLVATSAFGMGIDKPNIRYTVHYNIPQSLEAFYQEVGRAGRDRQTAHCFVLFSDDNPEQANRLLQHHVTNQQIRELLNTNWEAGDVHRLLYLFTITYRGIEDELAVARELLDKVMRLTRAKRTGETAALPIDFGTSDQQMARDKALYRLSILGVVSDYTVDHAKRKFEVAAAKLPDQGYITNLQRYIKRYKTREISDLVPQQVRQEPGNNVPEQCLSYLVKFVYEEIERKRRAAIKTMADISRSAARIKEPEKQNTLVWQQMLAYLEHSPFTEDLSRLSNQIDPEQWRAVLTRQDDTGAYLLQSVDGVRQLLGGCRRALESDTENPGLLFLSALARLLLPDPEIDLAMEELRASLGFLAVLPVQKQETACLAIFHELHEWLQATPDFLAVQERYSSVFIEALPSREIARLTHSIAPGKSENLLLNLMVGRLSTLNHDILFYEDIHREEGINE
jgi:ATP-dependent DNA helicase RecQ